MGFAALYPSYAGLIKGRRAPQLRHIHDYIAQDSPVYAKRVAEAIVRKTIDLDELPRIGRGGLLSQSRHTHSIHRRHSAFFLSSNGMRLQACAGLASVLHDP